MPFHSSVNSPDTSQMTRIKHSQNLLIPEDHELMLAFGETILYGSKDKQLPLVSPR